MTRKAYWMVGTVLASLVATGCPWDVDNNGKVLVACIGDSNTAPAFGSWCHKLTERVSDSRLIFQTYARNGASASTTPDNTIGDDHKPVDPLGLEDGQGQLDAALGGTAIPGAPKYNWFPEDLTAQGPADIVVIALGSNDVNSSDPHLGDPNVIAFTVGQLWQKAVNAGKKAFVATIPPQYKGGEIAGGTHNGEPDCTPSAIQPKIDALNALLQKNIPAASLIDFHTGFTCLDHYTFTDAGYCDPNPTIFGPPLSSKNASSIHLNDAGQLKRSENAYQVFKHLAGF